MSGNAPKRRMDNKRAAVEWLKCQRSAAYFLRTYCNIYNATEREWIPFALWPAQAEVLDTLQAERLTILLKARQLGFSWLVLCYALWLMLFHPAVTVALFSKRDDEATHLLDFRMKGVYHRLPAWMRAAHMRKSSGHEWQLSNGSVAMAFPTTGGRSYTATVAIVDEADFVPDLAGLLDAVKPTIDAGGRLILLSTVDKSQPNSAFKRIYRAAKAGANDYHAVFLPWDARPARDDAWYEAIARDYEARDGSRDKLWQEYPATDAEALAARTLNKRFAAQWLLACYEARAPLDATTLAEAHAPAIPGLRVYHLPHPGTRYVCGADSAEGNPTSDDSAATWLDSDGVEVASLVGKLEPAAFGAAIDAAGRWYNRAAVLPERNNHGHALILWLREHGAVPILSGHDGKLGWLSSARGKVLLYDGAVEAYRNGERTLHSFDTYTQLASIESNTLRAPVGDHDDLADSDALATVALGMRPPVAVAPLGLNKSSVWGKA